MNRYDNNFDWNKYSRSVFGTKYGNEACLNYFPIARSGESTKYDEEEYFFGIRLKEKFFSPQYENDRKKYFEEFLQLIKKRMLKEDIFLILMGGEPYDNLQSTVEQVFEIDFSKKKTEDKFILNDEKNKNKMIANKERNIWSVGHPEHRHFTEKDIKIVMDEIKNYQKKEV
ncbi:MAG: hypothetical protein ABI550_09820 [Ignavibacteriaceae bacterium]